MEHLSRRSLLATASATAAAAGVAAVVGSRTNEADAAPAPAAPAPAAALTAHVVARVRDLRTGEVDLFLGEKEVTVRDSSLAHAIARAAQQHTA
ncbi:twin-arginine translocation signal domain-containing protein [Jatrophihabitans sp. YIM 134969]